MEIPELLKKAIAGLDANLEEELNRYQYWRKYGRVPSVVHKFTQRSKPIPPEPLLPKTEPKMVPEPEEIRKVVPEPEEIREEAPPPQEPIEKESWLDWQTALASLVVMVVLGTVGYIGAEMLNIDRVLQENLPPPPSPQSPASENTPPPVAVKPNKNSNPPVSVRPPLPDPDIKNLPPLEQVPPPEATVVEQDKPIVVYKVIVDRQYLDRVQQIEPGAFIRPGDGVVQVAAFENVEDAKRMIETLLEKDIPARLE